jgi:hypothetical protein
VLPAPAAPQAEDPLTPVHDVPALVVLGFGGLLLAVVLGGAVHVTRVHRRTAADRPPAPEGPGPSAA